MDTYFYYYLGEKIINKFQNSEIVLIRNLFNCLLRNFGHYFLFLCKYLNISEKLKFPGNFWQTVIPIIVIYFLKTCLIFIFRMTKDPKHLYRALEFYNFMNTGEFQSGARTPDYPYSLFEGLAGTACFLADLTDPNQAKFPFSDVLSVH